MIKLRLNHKGLWGHKPWLSTLELRKEARKYDADYDGWETFVVR